MDQKCLEQHLVQVKQGIQKENEVIKSSSKRSVKGFEESDIEQGKEEDILQLVKQTKRENEYLELSNKYPGPDLVQQRKKIKEENEAIEPTIKHPVKGKKVKVEREIKQEPEEDLVQLIQQMKKENEAIESPSKHSVMEKEVKAEREIKQEKEEDLDTLIQQMKKENEAMESTSKYSVMGKEIKAEREIKQEREEDLVTLIQQMKKENGGMESISKHSVKEREVKVERDIKQKKEEDLVQLIPQLKKENEAMVSTIKHSVKGKEVKVERQTEQGKEEDLLQLIQQMKKENEAMELSTKDSMEDTGPKSEVTQETFDVVDESTNDEIQTSIADIVSYQLQDSEVELPVTASTPIFAQLSNLGQEPMEVVTPITTPTKFNYTQPPAIEPQTVRHQLQVSRKRPILPIPIESSRTSVVPLSVPAEILEKTPNAHLPTKKILLSVTLKPLNAQKVPLAEPAPTQASTPPNTLAITWRKPRTIRAITTQQFMPIANGQSTIAETPTQGEITSKSVSKSAVNVSQKDVLPPQTAITLSASNQTSEKIQQPNISTIAPETTTSNISQAPAKTNPENLRITRSKSVQKVTTPSEKQTRFAKRAPLKSCSEAIECIKLMEEYATTKENFQLLGFLETIEKLINK